MTEKATPVGTEKPSDNPELANLKEREKALSDKLSDLEKKDANQLARAGFDLAQIKQRTSGQLAEIRSEIQKLSK